MLFRVIYFFVTIESITISQIRLNPHGPVHEKFAISCIKTLINTQFKYMDEDGFQTNETMDAELLTVLTTKKMTSPGHEIQEKILKEINILSQFSIQVVLNNLRNIGPEIEPSFYFYVVDSMDHFWKSIDIITKTSNYNPNGLVLVYYSTRTNKYQKIASQILSKLWSLFMTNALLLIPKTLDNFVLLSLNFITGPSRHCLDSSDLVTIDHCVKGKLLNLRQYYSGKITNFFNCTIKVVANSIEPFVIDKNEGFEILMLEEIGKKLNITFLTHITEDDSWGDKTIDGNWSKGLGEVHSNRCIGVGAFYTLAEFLQDFDFARSHFSAKLVWVVPIAGDVPKWRVLTVIFSWYLWLLCIGLIIFGGFFLRLVSSFSKSEFKIYKKIGHDVFFSYQIMMMNVIPHQPQSDLTRLVFLALSVFSIIISATYTSSLINYLTLTQKEHQVDSVDDILHQEYDIGGLALYKTIFDQTQDKDSKEIVQRYKVSDDLLDVWLEKVSVNRNASTIGIAIYFRYLIATRDNISTDYEGKPTIFLVPKKILEFYVTIVVKEGFPFLEHLNHVIEQMTTGGIVLYLANTYTYRAQQYSQSGKVVQQLSIDHLQGPFAILILGFALGITSLLMENCVFYLEKLYKKRKIKKN